DGTPTAEASEREVPGFPAQCGLTQTDDKRFTYGRCARHDQAPCPVSIREECPHEEVAVRWSRPAAVPASVALHRAPARFGADVRFEPPAERRSQQLADVPSLLRLVPLQPAGP